MNQVMLQIERAPEMLTPAPPRRWKRSLGGAVIVAAIDDYRCPDEGAHKDAARFLFPRSTRRRDDLAWAVAMADGVNGDWLREALDQRRKAWDAERAARRKGRQRRCTQ